MRHGQHRNHTNQQRSKNQESAMNSLEQRLASVLTRSWWLVLLRGIAAIAFGILTWVQPGISLAALVLLFGAYSLADGIFALWTVVAGPKDHESWWMLLLGGLVGIGVGLLTLFEPGLTALALLFYIAIWAIATGVLEIAAAIRLRREIKGEWALVFAGLASVAFGIILAAHPGAGVLTVLWLIGAYAIVFGVLLVVLAFKARSFVSRVAHS
jgi:uncharacterized membrane protein HdeD (DUF308 family)